MLNRLKTPPMPAAIDTPLQVSEEPVADTGPYGRLRDEVTDRAWAHRRVQGTELARDGVGLGVVVG